MSMFRVHLYLVLVFFFKQKTAYEMRISDWSSDVCSSDLDAIRAADADYVFVIGWSQICGREFQAAAHGQVIGYHPAPLPRLRGRGVIPWTILADEPITAGTLFWIRSEEHTSELQSLMRISYAVFCLKKKKVKDQTLN